MSGKTVTIVGATGLVGSYLLQTLQNDDAVTTIKVLTRRPVSLHHPKLQVFQADFEDSSALEAVITGSDAVFCAIGTTRQKVNGDKLAYRKVDYDIPVRLAHICETTGCTSYLIVSSVGADSSSRNFYLRLKGAVEDKLKTMEIPGVHVFCPSMLLGKRKEFRFGERIAAVIMKTLSLIIPSKYRAIEAADVARAMAAVSGTEARGYHIYHYREIRELSAARISKQLI